MTFVKAFLPKYRIWLRYFRRL